MDEVRVWNVVRTQAQISANKGIEFCSNPTGLVAYYQFNLGVAGGTNTGLTTLPDLIGSNNGTLQTFSLTGSLSNWITGVALTRRGAINTQSISICSRIISK